MATVNYQLSSKVDKHLKKSEALIRFTYGNGLALRAKSNVFIPSSRWNTKDSCLIIPRLDTPEKKELTVAQKTLDDLKNSILNSFIETDKDRVSKEWLHEIIDRFHYPEKYEVKPSEKPTFFQSFDHFLDVRKLSDVRKRNFKVIGRALQRFEMYKKHKGDNGFVLSLDGISIETLREFEKFLSIEYTFFTKDEQNKFTCTEEYRHIFESVPESRTPQPRGQNTINDVFTKLRTFFLWSIEAGLTDNNPFKNYAIEECVYGTPYYISIEERNILFNTDLSHRPQLAIQRDIFVFQCLIGCRVGDLYKMTKENVINGSIQYIPRKTKDGRPITVEVPLNSIAAEILERYENTDINKLFPFISEQKYNIAIKAMFLEAGITRKVVVRNPTTGESEIKPINKIASSHLARRCFVGNLYKQVKDPNLVGSLSGHKEGSKAFARYREIDKTMKIELVKLLEKGGSEQ